MRKIVQSRPRMSVVTIRKILQLRARPRAVLLALLVGLSILTPPLRPVFFQQQQQHQEQYQEEEQDERCRRLQAERNDDHVFRWETTWNYDITPLRRDSMFCAVTPNSIKKDRYLAVAGVRHPNWVMVYEMDKSTGEVIRENQPRELSSLYEDFWEDPRLVRDPTPAAHRAGNNNGSVLVVVVCRGGQPMGVARLFENNQTTGPVSKLSLVLDQDLTIGTAVQVATKNWSPYMSAGTAIQVATKNWSPLFYNGTLHLIISYFPLIVIRCESDDFVYWNRPCYIVSSDKTLPANWSSFQERMLFRGGTQLEPWPHSPSNTYIGFIHSRIKCRSSWSTSSLRTNCTACAYLYRSHLVVIRSTPQWEVLFVSKHYRARLTPATPSSLARERNVQLSNWIQSPASIVHIDPITGQVTVTYNIGDEHGRCAMGFVDNPITQMHRSTSCSRTKFQLEPIIRDLEETCVSLQRKFGNPTSATS